MSAVGYVCYEERKRDKGEGDQQWQVRDAGVSVITVSSQYTS